MVKRRKVTSDSEDDWNLETADEAISEDAFCPSDHASGSQRTRRKRVKAPVSSAKRRKVLPTAEPTSSSASASSSTVSIHTRSAHVIANADDIRPALLNWFEGVRETRGMPWRKKFDHTHSREQRAQRAYEVWISEIMLQQTQVVTVIPYYNRWMAKYPTVKDLAEGDIDEVNALWKGLGYYSRASRLLAGAQKVVEELGGLLPNNAKDMEKQIPGIGRYSAGAICSIAYGENVPVLDGNVTRLLSRFLRLYANSKAKGALDLLWAGAEAMVQVKGAPGKDSTWQNPGDINQALIELGSTVCRVRDPDCGACPLRDWCGAYKLAASDQGAAKAPQEPDIEDLCQICEPLPSPVDVTQFPMKVAKKAAREETDIVNVVEWRASGGERWFLLTKRPEKGLLAGLHEFPTLSNVGAKPDLEQIPHDLLAGLLIQPPIPLREPRVSIKACLMGDSQSAALRGAKIVKIEQIGAIPHVFSHIKKTYRAQWVLLEGGDEPPTLKSFPLDSTSASAFGQYDTKTQNKGNDVARDAVRGKSKSKRAQKKSVTGPDASDGNEGSPPEGGVAPVDAKWVAYENVDAENVGTGVVKVWQRAQKLWGASST